MGAIRHKKKVAPSVNLKFFGAWPLGVVSLNSLGVWRLTKHFILLCGNILIGIVN